MDYGSIFASQSPLTDFTQKFSTDSQDKRERATMLQDVLDYLDLDLRKVSGISRQVNNKSMFIRHGGDGDSSPNQKGLAEA